MEFVESFNKYLPIKAMGRCQDVITVQNGPSAGIVLVSFLKNEVGLVWMCLNPGCVATDDTAVIVLG